MRGVKLRHSLRSQPLGKSGIVLFVFVGTGTLATSIPVENGVKALGVLLQ